MSYEREYLCSWRIICSRIDLSGLLLAVVSVSLCIFAETLALVEVEEDGDKRLGLGLESITSVILYNMSVAYSLQNLDSLALQTCQFALECTRLVPNAHRGMLIKTLVLRRIYSLLVGRAGCEKDIIGKDAEQQRHQVGQIAFASGLDPTQISEELFTYEVYMLTIYPSGAMAA